MLPALLPLFAFTQTQSYCKSNSLTNARYSPQGNARFVKERHSIQPSSPRLPEQHAIHEKEELVFKIFFIIILMSLVKPEFLSFSLNNSGSYPS